MNSRRSFIKNAALGSIAITTASSYTILPTLKPSMAMPKISLAQWSIHRAIRKGDLKAVDFAKIAKNTYGIKAVEYVNQFYTEMATSSKFWQQMKGRADDEDVRSLLIMVDAEGDIGNPKDSERITAVENHYKWIHAAKILGCHSIRVNAFGKGTKDELRNPLVDGLGKLSAYGAKEGINVLIENHGLHTSDGAYMASIIKEVNNPYLGTLPDFGNWCLNMEWGGTQGNKCNDVYDPYQGVKDFLPYAKGVSAKTYEFDSNGNESMLDYKKLLQIVKNSDFDGYIGIEYEGEKMSEYDGIMATKNLIERAWKNLD